MTHRQKFRLLYTKAVFHELNAWAMRSPLLIDKEAVHAFRVAFKKLRAIMKLIRYAQLSPSRPPAGLVKLYKTTGKYRDTQMEQQWFSHLPASKENLWLPYHTRIVKSEFKYIMPMKIAAQKLKGIEMQRFRKMTALAIIALEDETVSRFIHKRVSALEKEMTKHDIKRKNLHDIRKSLKDIIYLVDFAGIRYHDKLLHKDINEVQQSIGKWHDSKQSLDHLLRFKSLLPSKSSLRLKIHTKALKKEENRLFKKSRKMAYQLA